MRSWGKIGSGVARGGGGRLCRLQPKSCKAVGLTERFPVTQQRRAKVYLPGRGPGSHQPHCRYGHCMIGLGSAPQHTKRHDMT